MRKAWDLVTSKERGSQADKTGKKLSGPLDGVEFTTWKLRL